MPDDIAFLIVVFDGLQPAQITPGVMPNLAQFASSGTRFDNHHPVFPTVTRVNVASLVTGVLPGRHGIAGNTFLCRDFDPCKVIPAMKDTLTALGEKTGRVLLTPNLADILGQHGKQYVAIGTGTSGNAFLHNPNAANAGGATIHPDFTLTVGLHTELDEALWRLARTELAQFRAIGARAQSSNQLHPPGVGPVGSADLVIGT